MGPPRHPVLHDADIVPTARLYHERLSRRSASSPLRTPGTLIAFSSMQAFQGVHIMNGNHHAARWETAIKEKYAKRLQDFPHDPPLGWRLLYSPRRVLSGARVAFIGFNPGGSSIVPSHGEFSTEKGSAYRKDVEDWGPSSRLQDQVMELFRRLKVHPDEVLAGNLVPFRSPDENSLKGRADAVAFGRNLWTEILDVVQPTVVVSMGGGANREIRGLLNVENVETVPVGWGTITGSRGQFSGGHWIGLPHLSRFTIMNRQASQSALDTLFRSPTGG